MTRVTFVIRRLNRGGAERQLLELLKGLDKARFEVDAITLYPGGALWEEACSVPGVRIQHLGKKGRWHVQVLPTLLRIFRQTRPDIVHGYMDIANLLALAGRSVGARVVWGIRASKVDSSVYDRLRRVAIRLESWLSSFPDLIICNSDAARSDALARGFPNDRMVVIPNGIDTDRFRGSSAARSELRAIWGVSANESLIGIVARLDPMKGHSVFLTAAREVARLHQQARFAIIGGGRLLPELTRQAAQLGLQERLIWAGERNDVPAVLSALDLSISASLFGEGFSNALAESMACGVPCVASNVGDAGRILGDCGWLVPSGDAAALARGICGALESRMAGKVRGDLLRQRIVSEFGLERLARATESALGSLMTSGSGPAERAPQ
ncbi:MAG TPA: glycosyltransferase [Steroidobacteraceae bacterium]|jgi:glycosyltransferase involved in cell wall biosynthesis|nr:glycosyltransferase [Steroidobacteraceae bacterium]